MAKHSFSKLFILCRLMACASTLYILGCGGQDKLNVQGEPLGQVRVRIEWPSREIPADTKTIEVWACATSGKRLKRLRLTYPTTEGLIERIPTGPGTIRAYALNEVETILATGESNLQVVPGTSNDAVVTLDAVVPPIDDDRYIIGGSVALDPDNPSLVRLTLNALVNREDGRPALGLTSENFVVYEDGIRRSPILVNQTSGVPSKTDLVFVVDTTGSMGDEIAGVRDSIISFAGRLVANGQDVRYGGVEFGDDVRTSLPFTRSASEFSNWTAGLTATGGDDDPENPLDAIVSSVESQTWRSDSQHIIVVLTDNTVHEADFVTPRTMESVRDLLIGSFVVHAISPGSPSLAAMNRNGGHAGSTRSTGATGRDIRVLAETTGGIWASMPPNGAIDLNNLSLLEVILAGYTIKFASNKATPPIEREIRLAVSLSSSFVADQMFPARY